MSKNNYTVVKIGRDSSGRDLWMTRFMAAWWDAVCALLGFNPVITQGAFQSRNGGGAEASAGTHKRAGVMDLRTWNLTDEQKSLAIRTCRRMGAAAWLRTVADGFDEEHIHLILGEDSPLSSEAAGQWAEYLAGGDGLAGNGKDPHWRPEPLVTTVPDITRGDDVDAAIRRLTKAAKKARRGDRRNQIITALKGLLSIRPWIKRK
jgi:hypothetical protein